MRAFALVLLVGTASAFVEKNEWNEYKLKHGKAYANPIEEFYRMKVYADNKEYVDQHMKEYAEGKHTFTVALNKFADLTTEEWNSMYKGLKMGSSMPHELHKPTGEQAPAYQDWREYHAVSEVKDQGQCGSCWAFSATGSLESAWLLSRNPMVTLSEQQLVDCSTAYGNDGCNGGLMDKAFRYIQANGGIESESAYPYTASDGLCQTSGSSAASLSSYVDVARGSEDALMDAVGRIGPISVAIDASKRSFQLYSSGIYNEPTCSSSQLDHGVLAVGYSSDYWIVKNSWGYGWGEAGYVKMTRDGSNQCGIATMASYPKV